MHIMKRFWMKKNFLKKKYNTMQQLRCSSAMSCFKNDVPFDDQLDCEAIEELHEADEALPVLTEDALEQGESKATSAPEIHLRKRSLFLLNYVQACVNTGHWSEAVDRVVDRDPFLPRDMQSVEYLLQMLLKLRKSPNKHFDAVEAIISLFHKVLRTDVSPTPNACACMLAAMHWHKADPSIFKSVLGKIEQLHDLHECLRSCHHQGQVYRDVTSAISFYKPDFVFEDATPFKKDIPQILTNLYSNRPSNASILLPPSMSRNLLMKRFNEQLQMEKEGTVSIPNVLSAQQHFSRSRMKHREKLKELHDQWFDSALSSFKIMKERERRNMRDRRYRSLSVYPFLCVLRDGDYIDIMINHLRHMPRSGEITVNTAMELGDKVFSRYALKHYLDSKAEHRLNNLYYDYVKLYTKPGREVLRERWEEAEHRLGSMLQEGHIAPWQNLCALMVGKKLLEIMVSTFTVTIAGESKVPSAYFKGIPAVFNSYKPWGNKTYGMTVPHPVYHSMVTSAKEDFMFETGLLPMVVPPLPWLHQNQGGFLCVPTEFVRRKDFADICEQDNSEEYNSRLCTIADALNVQGSVAWKVNERVLDVQLKIFRGKGNEKLKIAPPPPDVPSYLRKIRSYPPEERRNIFLEYFRAKKLQNEMNSLHADALYKFSIANFYRDKVIWLPHNLDFRGRSYPIPPHFNYMGDDVSRSLFMFADGKELGKRGLEWLQIHLINLTGSMKYEELRARKEYAGQMIDEIFDSADHPLDGRGWWKNSEEPWQTLAACMELTAALRSPDPEKYVSHLAVYQDGSCNGLQHYAALGRDTVGAEQVNLKRSRVPQDVYIAVANVVERQRKEDAEKGVAIAKSLEGFVSRKVVKQTVMTTVYGVTRYGGAQQIKKQLVGLEKFPTADRLEASAYLVDAVFSSISSIFTSATNIQRWLTEIAECVTKGGRSVEWSTVLGLLAVQPYFKTSLYLEDSRVQRFHLTQSTSRPNIRKQCNAFPPNFIHSLDSTHMMLTALHSFHAGVKFSAVHDCYWTHASSVDHMNELCRDQFIALHNHPILEDLANHLSTFLPDNDHDVSDSSQYIARAQRAKLRELLANIPAKGNFDLNMVRESTFFFS